jgi:hypothetical protein
VTSRRIAPGDGSGVPADQFTSGGPVCRPSAGDGDAAETCPGNGPWTASPMGSSRRPPFAAAYCPGDGAARHSRIGFWLHPSIRPDRRRGSPCGRRAQRLAGPGPEGTGTKAAMAEQLEDRNVPRSSR